MAEFSFEPQYPDLFAGLAADEKWMIEQALADGRLEGWQPSREEVVQLIAAHRGELSEQDFIAWAVEHARRVSGSDRAAV